MKTLRLNDDLAYRIARVRQAADGDAAAIDVRKIELADAVLKAADAPAVRRMAKLEAVGRPEALAVDIAAPAGRRRRA